MKRDKPGDPGEFLHRQSIANQLDSHQLDQ